MSLRQSASVAAVTTTFLSLSVSAAIAQTVPPPKVAPSASNPRIAAPFFSELGNPGAGRARRLLSQARWQRSLADQRVPGDWESTCRRALPAGAHMDREDNRRASMRTLRGLASRALERRAELDNALERLYRARELDPDNPAVAFQLADTLAQWEEPGPLWKCEARRRTREAIAAYVQLGHLAPSYRPSAVAGELAVLYTRARRFDDAQRAYERAIVLSLDGRHAATTHMNLAEVTMHAGDLEGAVARYKQALHYARDDRDRSLSLWGLAVALDRLGEHEAALTRATQALQAEGGHMRVLHSPGVFFEPRHEIHYYEALGFEAQAKLEPEGAGQSLKEAARSWRAFLANSQADAAFSENARENLARLETDAPR